MSIKKAELDDFNRNLKFLETALKKDHKLKLKELDLEHKESQVKLQSEKNRITEIYNSYSNTVKQLQLQGKSNQLDQREIGLDKRGVRLDRQDLDNRRTLIKMLEKNLTESFNIPAISEYNRHGYQLDNPYERRVKYLEDKVQELSDDKDF